MIERMEHEHAIALARQRYEYERETLDMLTVDIDGQIAALVASQARQYHDDGMPIVAQYLISRTFYHRHITVEFLYIWDAMEKLTPGATMPSNLKVYYDRLCDRLAQHMNKQADHIKQPFAGLLKG